jgi:hypothetical protein
MREYAFLRTVVMIRILLALGLAAVCSASALAGQRAKTEDLSGGPYAYGTADERFIVGGVFVPHSKKLRDALGGWNRGDPNDPYWDPCISYQRSWGPGACGGNR